MIYACSFSYLLYLGLELSKYMINFKWKVDSTQNYNHKSIQCHAGKREEEGSREWKGIEK